MGSLTAVCGIIRQLKNRVCK